MAHLGTAELVSAVCNAGGLGIIGAGYYQPEWVRQQIHRTRERTDRPFGINLPLTSPYADEIIALVLEENLPVVTTGVGDPTPFVPAFRQLGMKVMPVVAAVSAARRLEEAGVDAVVTEGMESGGHIGETTTMALVPQVVDALRIPVVAAGGIADGRGLAAALALGAEGVQVGTRFACSQESVAHPAYKQRVIEAHDRSTVITGRTTRLPLRSLKNSFTEQFQTLEDSGATPEELGMLGEGRMHLGLIDGDLENGSLLAGQIAGMIREVKPVKAIIEEMVAEAEAVLTRLESLRRGEDRG